MQAPPFLVASAAFMVLSSARSDDATVTTEKTVPHLSTDLSGHRLTLAGLRRRRGRELHPGVRSADRLSVRERAADRARDVVGSWSFAAAELLLVAVGVGEAVRHDPGAGPVAVLGVVLSGLALVGLSLVLMAVGRGDRTAGEVALHQLDADRRAAAGIAELRDEVEQLRADVARVTARLETSALRPKAEETSALRPKAEETTG